MSQQRSASQPVFSAGANRRSTLLAATALSILTTSSAIAATDGDSNSNQLLLEKLERMERRIQSLESELKQKKAAEKSADKSAAPAKEATTSGKDAKPAAAPETTGSIKAAPDTDRMGTLREIVVKQYRTAPMPSKPV